MEEECDYEGDEDDEEDEYDDVGGDKYFKGVCMLASDNVLDYFCVLGCCVLHFWVFIDFFELVFFYFFYSLGEIHIIFIDWYGVHCFGWGCRCVYFFVCAFGLFWRMKFVVVVNCGLFIICLWDILFLSSVYFDLFYELFDIHSTIFLCLWLLWYSERWCWLYKYAVFFYFWCNSW